MAWVGIIDGRCLPVVWFEGSVNGEVYREKFLKDTVQPNVKHVATRKKYRFQHDAASCHVTAQYSSFLRTKFGDRIISRNTQHHWPPYSPVLSPLDYSFCSQCTQYVKKVKPKDICDLRRRVQICREHR